VKVGSWVILVEILNKIPGKVLLAEIGKMKGLMKGLLFSDNLLPAAPVLTRHYCRPTRYPRRVGPRETYCMNN
jgi:hypothetical protein